MVLVKKSICCHTDFSLDKVKEDIAQINPSATVFMVSGRTGEGIETWILWLLGEVKKKKPLKIERYNSSFAVKMYCLFGIWIRKLLDI